MPRRKSLSFAHAVLVLVVVAANSLALPAWGMGQEVIGNEPLHANSEYPEGLMPVINEKHRVYYSWVNGNEHFYFQGETAALNDTLKQFALVDAPEHNVVLLPGPGKAQRFDETPMACDWTLHVVGGIVKSMTERRDEAGVWDKHPTLTVYVSGGSIDLDRIELPEGITLLTRDDLKARYLKAITSTSEESRSHAAIFLATVDPFGKDSAHAIQTLLKDEDSYVRACAASSLALMGKIAESALPDLRECLKNGDRYTESYQRAIDKISQGPDLANEAKAYEETAKSILVFTQKTRAAHKTP
ncbi:MAG: HEAT repeat domain-containing protein [Candidatus Hydrogenedentes bacterium]|nr:HEAT repeat domain-containing protein [Candidatus Hydrogenedentota bacterium]